MNHDALEIILNNGRADIARDVRGRVAELLDAADALPGQPNHAEHPDIDICREVGDVVLAMVREYAADEYGLNEDDTTLTGEIFDTTLGHMDWAEVGRYYYVTAQ